MSIFLDFDGTITTADTVSELAAFALRHQRVRRAEGGADGDDDDDDDSGEGRGDLKARWDDVVRQYLEDLKAHSTSYVPRAEERLTPELEVAYLRAGKDVEMRSLERIGACGIFRGIDGEQFQEAGREVVREGRVRLRKGFGEFVKKRLDKGWRIYVISVNWSARFIEGACGFGDGKVEVIANEVDGDGTINGPEILNPKTRLPRRESDEERGRDKTHRNLTNSRDKLDVMEAIIKRDGLSHEPTLYFGDSTTDLECLFKATTGVIIADDVDSSLLQTARRLGEVFPRVHEPEARAGLHWAADFDEVLKSC
ncbi:hypothetical protein F5Y15DRAFT_367189 [Xylariaceae sp. FL0016]|nr:hypothetical protein F5Y15DRAFT_367189 [Xylariaceae sp. FL0016]